ncbi:MAG: hypothetical protein ACQEWU_12890 [Bacillota bacterium]|nr:MULTISPECIES: hypothetical protein [Bacillaceae]MDY7045824.1 hypothetical protein [Virgibacillus sp. M23]WBX81927.1 hypothetical protein PD280_09875 [Virgibacillus salarius]
MKCNVYLKIVNGFPVSINRIIQRSCHEERQMPKQKKSGDIL